MTYEEIMEKNLTLSFEFSLYVAQHPEFASHIPPNSRVVLLPGDDPELAHINRETVDKSLELDDEPSRPIVYVEFKRLLPARSRLVRPRVRSPRALALA
ncbi:MAG: hypothetical protein FJ009_15020 [Chloroflexi bacterium]|nr:hypothetical protein [Chloroflexota bacterium]